MKMQLQDSLQSNARVNNRSLVLAFGRFSGKRIGARSILPKIKMMAYLFLKFKRWDCKENAQLIDKKTKN